MAGSDEWRGAAATVPPGHRATFRFERDGRAVGTPLDLWPNDFFTEDGRALRDGARRRPSRGRGPAGRRAPVSME
jgi:hypothetical protein